MERTGVITFKGNGLTLVGPELKVGDAAPDFTATGGGLEEVKLSDFCGSVVIISAVPSLDTPVCEMQTKRFNEEAAKLDAKVITISMDLPFAQGRFCEANKVEGVTCVSDYKDRSFANAYGLFIKELALVARAVFVVGKDGKLVYQQIVPEVTDQPDYDKVLEAAKSAGA